ncbi:unnamed protein product, partial [Brassica oleracea]
TIGIKNYIKDTLSPHQFPRLLLLFLLNSRSIYPIYKGLSPNLSHEVAILMLSSYTVVINCKLSMYFHEYSKDSLLT